MFESPESLSAIQRLRLSVGALVALIAIGTIGYEYFEGMSHLDGLYYTVITLTTIGYGEPPGGFTSGGKAFTVALVIVGLGTFSILISNIARIVISGEVRGALGELRMDRRLKNISNHFIVCGYGRLGAAIAKSFKAQSTPFVVLEMDETAYQEAIEAGCLAIHGDASNDDILEAASLTTARGLISVCAEDAINVYITLTARQLSPSLRILARASSESAEKKLMRAGASRTFSPYTFGGTYMAQAALRPTVVDFFDMASLPTAASIFLEEILMPQNSPVGRQTLRELQLSQRFGVIVVAIRHHGEAARLEFNPSARSAVEPGDLLISLGESSNLQDVATFLKTGEVRRSRDGATQSIVIATDDGADAAKRAADAEAAREADEAHHEAFGPGAMMKVEHGDGPDAAADDRPDDESRKASEND